MAGILRSNRERMGCSGVSQGGVVLKEVRGTHECVGRYRSVPSFFYLPINYLEGLQK